jgi:hypothetical protein
MKKRYDQSPGVNAVALAAGSILSLIIAATLTLAFGNPPVDGSTAMEVADSASVYR